MGCPKNALQHPLNKILIHERLLAGAKHAHNLQNLKNCYNSSLPGQQPATDLSLISHLTSPHLTSTQREAQAPSSSPSSLHAPQCSLKPPRQTIYALIKA